MKKHKGWSYAPYKPLFFDTGDIYICRLTNGDGYFSCDWLECEGCTEYTLYYRERGSEDEFINAGTTAECTFKVSGLDREKEYEFYVASGEKKSRVRLTVCKDAVGTVVNYLHPDDECYKFSGRYLCSPSLVRHPDGYLLASMDLFAPSHPQNLTLIFRSDDEGKTWKYVSELFPCFWGKMFINKGELYMLACSTEYGDMLIGKSTDGGKTFTEPTVLFRGLNGKNGSCGIHRNPEPVVYFNGRIWNTVEWGSWSAARHDAMVVSADENSDLLDANSWCFSEPVRYSEDWEGVPKGESSGNIEGSLVVLNNKLYNIMRYDMTKLTPNHGLVIRYEVDTYNPEAPLKFDGVIKLDGNHSKFMIKHSEKTGKFYTVISRITSDEMPYARNLLSLMESQDCEKWVLKEDLLDYSCEDPKKIGFQYVDFEIEGDKIIWLCRTAMNGAHSFHDSNYQTFHVTEL